MRIQKKHSTFVFTDEDKRHIHNIRSHLKDIKTDTSAIRVALKMLSDEIDSVRQNKK